MDVNKLCIPNASKWISYYHNSVNGKNNPFLTKLQNGGKIGNQIGGSLSGGRSSFMVPIESNTSQNKQSSSNNMLVNMVSPTEQTVQMAENQIKNRGVKRKRISSKPHSSKRRRVQQTNKSKRKYRTVKKRNKSYRKKPKPSKKGRKSKPVSKRKILKAKRRVFPVKDILS